MEEQSVDPALLELLKKLQAKYDAMGQDLNSYLNGLLHSDYLTYWDYIHLDTLLSLQSPKTRFADEKVFIIYHQITELYFQLVLHELEQIGERKPMESRWLLERMQRVVRYFRNLEASFEIMSRGLEREQFLAFRMALLPSSGFQSAQFRFIEFASTNLINLVEINHREAKPNSDLKDMYDRVYWKSGATELATGSKTLTLKQFEEKYSQEFLEFIGRFQHCNLQNICSNLVEDDPLYPDLIRTFREYDVAVNLKWRFAHLRSSGQYLHRSPEDIKATGGTNWQRYLPPRFQKIIFFPQLWSDTEREHWGETNG